MIGLLLQNYLYFRESGQILFPGSSDPKLSALDGLSSAVEKPEDMQSMKRIGNLWNEFISKENVIVSVIEGTERKRGDRSVQKILFSPEEVEKNRDLYHKVDPARAYAFMLPFIEQLNAGTWKHEKPRYIRRYCRNRASSKGKWRDLYVPALPDHIIGHMAYSAARVAFERGMHPHCCGSVRGRGIMHIVRTVRRWLRIDSQCRYFVKLDIRHFFDSIDPDRLMNALQRKIKDEKILNIFEQIIHSSPSACPVGYYTSPMLANLYLERMDWYIDQDLYKERRGKRVKWVRHYLRYMDDMLLIGSSKTDLYKAVRKIREYLAGLGLELKKSWEIKKIGSYENGELTGGACWIDIGGYKFAKNAVTLRPGIFLATRRLAKKMNKSGFYTEHQSQSIQARLAWAGHCDSFHFVEREVLPYVNLKATKRRIGNVEKKRKRGKQETCRA